MSLLRLADRACAKRHHCPWLGGGGGEWRGRFGLGRHRTPAPRAMPPSGRYSLPTRRQAAADGSRVAAGSAPRAPHSSDSRCRGSRYAQTAKPSSGSTARGLKLARQFLRRAPSAHQLNHVTAEPRRIGSSALRRHGTSWAPRTQIVRCPRNRGNFMVPMGGRAIPRRDRQDPQSSQRGLRCARSAFDSPSAIFANLGGLCVE
jgi:hypothetical protein